MLLQVQALPATVKQSLESPETHYSHGYSIGREALEDGQPDVHKASFYADPLSVPADPEPRKGHSDSSG